MSGMKVVSSDAPRNETVEISIEDTLENDDQVVQEQREEDEVSEDSDEDEKPSKSDKLEKGDDDSGDDDADDEDDKESEDDESQDDKESEEKAEKKAKGKRKSGFQKRVDKLRAREEAANEKAEYWRREAQKNSQPLKDEGKYVDTTEAVQASEKPNVDDFETYEDYSEALTDWKVDKRFQAMELKNEQKAMQDRASERVQLHNEKVDDYKAENSDFDDDVADFIAEYGRDFNLSMPLEEAITESELGPAVMHELLRNPDEFMRINSLGVMATARAVGRLEARIDSKASPKEGLKTKKETTKAKAPLSSVKAKGASAPKSIYDKGLSQADYDKIRDKQNDARGNFN